MYQSLPLKIGVTMGDVAGIGSEIILKTLLFHNITHRCKIYIYGNKLLFESTANKIKIFSSSTPKLFANFQTLLEGITFIDLPCEEKNLMFSSSNSKYGKLAYISFIAAIKDAQQKKIDSIVTAPINKYAFHLAGLNFEGHTEILAQELKASDYGMLFISPKLKVLLVSVHVALKQAIKNLSSEKIYQKICLGNRFLNSIGKKKIKIAVCGINPHAGEHKLYGNEEDIIQQAIDKAQKEGINVSGPYPADTIFYQAIQKKYSLVVAMYHDQGLIPVKTLNFKKTVNVTIGLPFIRTSVDHGTAYDIAGKGIADESNLIYAIDTAIKLSKK